MWSQGTISCPVTGKKYRYCVKHYEEPSDVYGLNGGRISKLSIRALDSTTDLCCYERGWDIEPAAEVEAVYNILLEKYN
jgi:hypothetical protein